MNSGISGDQDTNNIHGKNVTSIPKWFEDITENKPTSKVQDPIKMETFNLNDVYHRNDIEMPIMNRQTSLSGSAKFGRRASITSQILASACSTNTTMSQSKYLIPHLGDDFSLLSGNQDELEEQWRGLSFFQKSHRGRLDSANEINRETVSMDYTVLSPLQSSHSLAKLESYSAPNTQFNLKNESNDFNLTSKSIPSLLSNIPVNKSSENVIGFSGTFGVRPSSNMLSIEKQLNEYKLNVAREDVLRREIIKELLSENEIITKKISETTSQLNNRKIVRTPSFEDIAANSKRLSNRKTRYKNKNGVAKYGPINLEDPLIGDTENFIIPELPSGKILVLNILSTWGDKHYVGLNGIEIFGDDGKLVPVEKISASPRDVTVLPECKNDPRVVTNILDGINRTQDDVHLWLAPFDKGQKHTVTIEFKKTTCIAMIRIWNYNKSRIHSYRGVKDMIITLDGRKIFKGEIAKACGGILGGVDAFGDTILFTLNNEILDLISQNDNSYNTLTSSTHPDSPKTDRPPTASLLPNDEERPFTGIQLESSTRRKTEIYDDQLIFGGTCLKLVLLSNWGNKNMIGLCGLEIIDDIENPITIDKDDITCNIESDIFDLERLITGENLSVNAEDMWCIPYEYAQETIISINFSGFTYVKGIRIWNYNESLETTYAGVSRIKILLDDKLIINPITKDDFFLVRRAPGNIHYDFVQDIFFHPLPNYILSVASTPSFNITHQHKEEFYEYPVMPEGFVIQFIIFSTWGDQYYCGLNGIELYEQNGRKILLDSSNICAYPESVNVLPSVDGDIRTPDKLIDQINEDSNGRHSWLAPIMPKSLNRIYIVLDQPVTISVIKLWNYSKTPSRGVKEFGILVDDLLIYNGILDKYSSSRCSYRTVAFTDDANVLEQELDTLIRHSSYGQEVVMMNENIKCTTGGSNSNADPALRPFTSVSPVLRRAT